MYKHCNLMFLVCESPLHAGSGSDLDFIDNPIQRERHTGYPKIESSSLKGAIRERFTEIYSQKDGDIEIVFGPDSPEAGQERQGSIGFTDARLLLFPIKSMRGVFAWATCPAALERFRQDMQKVNLQDSFTINGSLEVAEGKCMIFSDALTIKNKDDKEHIVLEEFAFDVLDGAGIEIEGSSLPKWLADKVFGSEKYTFWNTELTNKLAILSDDDFKDFVELTTEVITRNKINPETGTVQKGHLFTEEYLPADSVLYALVVTHAEFHRNGEGKPAEWVMDYFTENMSKKMKNAFQVGGNATLGKGLLRTALMFEDTLEIKTPS